MILNFKLLLFLLPLVWFQAFRYMMLTGALIQLANLITMIALTTFKSDKYKKPWPLFSYGFLIAGR